MYGENIAALEGDRYTVAWDDQTMPDSNHHYHASKLNCICRATDDDGRDDDQALLRIPAVNQDESSSESDSSEEEDEENKPGGDFDRERDIAGSPMRRSPRQSALPPRLPLLAGSSTTWNKDYNTYYYF